MLNNIRNLERMLSFVRFITCILLATLPIYALIIPCILLLLGVPPESIRIYIVVMALLIGAVSSILRCMGYLKDM